jgi:hypothetical protein
MVVRLKENFGFGSRQETHTNFLFFNCIARPQGGGTADSPESCGGKKQREECAEMKARRQNALIVTGESRGSKRPLGRDRGGNLDGSARPAAVNASETCVRMIARIFARGGFLFSLLVGHALIDALENLLFRESNIFEAADRNTGECRLS